MKYMSSFAALAALYLIGLSFMPTTAYAQSSVLDRTVYSQRNLTASEPVEGDVLCINEVTEIRATITGDVLCAAGTVEVYGTIRGDLRTAASTVRIFGDITGSLTALSSNVTIEQQGSVGRDISGTIGTLEVKGRVGRDVTGAASSANITGSVGRDVNISANTLTVTKDASIEGWVRHYNAQTVDIADSAVTGEVRDYQQTTNQNGASIVALLAVTLLSLGAYSIGVTLLAPRFIHRATTKGARSPFITLLVGATSSIVVPLLTISLIFSGALLPFGLLLFALYVCGLLLCVPVAWHGLGRAIVGKQTNNIALTAIIGSGIIVSLLFVPMLNIIVVLYTVLFGIGSLALWLYGTLKNPRYSVTQKDTTDV